MAITLLSYGRKSGSIPGIAILIVENISFRKG
jgi:hypothetical protein